jgi:hypothetical protein
MLKQVWLFNSGSFLERKPVLQRTSRRGGSRYEAVILRNEKAAYDPSS